MIENLIMCTCIQNFDSVASHLELAILSRKFRITEHAQSSAVEYFNFFSIEINLSLQDLHFHQVMGIMLQRQVIYWDFSIFRITTLDPCHRRHELKDNPPKTVGDVRKIVGLLGYYHRYIKDFAKIANHCMNCCKFQKVMVSHRTIQKVNVHQETR